MTPPRLPRTDRRRPIMFAHRRQVKPPSCFASAARVIDASFDWLFAGFRKRRGIFDPTFMAFFIKYVLAALLSGQVFNYIHGVHPFVVDDEQYVLIFPGMRSQFLVESYIIAGCYWFMCNSFIKLIEIGYVTQARAGHKKSDMLAPREAERGVVTHLIIIIIGLLLVQSIMAAKMPRYPFGMPDLLE